MASILRERDIDRTLATVSDGNTFERFAQQLLLAKGGDAFVPVGGTGDLGRDGLERVSIREGKPKHVYQMSIQKDAKSKIAGTIKKLRDNSIEFDRITYVTSLAVQDAADIEDHFEEEEDVIVRIRDRAWITTEVNRTEQTARIFLSHFGGTVTHFAEGGVERAVAPYVEDPRVYVFLQQQLESAGPAMRLDNVVLDGLILYVLEGTSPDDGILKTQDEIIAAINELSAYVPKRLTHKVARRLKALSTKPRKIRLHKNQGYCLPYETRAGLLAQNTADAALLEHFQESARRRMDHALDEHGQKLDESHKLVSDLCGRIFKEQGLEFAAFVKGDAESYEQPSLSDWAKEVAATHVSGAKTTLKVADALARTMRDIVYAGEPHETEYLRKLSETFVVLFTLQCDPAVAGFFADLTSGLTLWVDNSILVPAISEIPLPAEHRRFQNLLRIAADAGATLLVDAATVRELATHVARTCSTYEDVYAGRESIFNNEATIAGVNEILIRSFLYSRLRDPSATFHKFIDRFVSPSDPSNEEELIDYLKGLGLQFRERILEDLPAERVSRLAGVIRDNKSHSVKADNDARTLLGIAETRLRKGERSQGIFGYSTWWLTQDLVSARALEQTFGKEYPGSPCMRPDFLYNYICLSPRRSEVEGTFDRVFPSLLGVTLSHHLDAEVTKVIKQLLKHYDGQDKTRLSARLRRAVNALMAEEERRSPEELKHYLEEALSGQG